MIIEYTKKAHGTETVGLLSRRRAFLRDFLEKVVEIFGKWYYFYYLCIVKININIFMRRYTVREIIKMLKNDGWYQIKGGQTSGDHRQFKHPTKKGRVTVRGKPSDVLGQELLNSIWKQAGWK